MPIKGKGRGRGPRTKLASATQVTAVSAGNDDVLLFNSAGPSGILVPAASAPRLQGVQDVWATAQELVARGEAQSIPVRQLETLSAGLTGITLLMPPAEGGTLAAKVRGGARNKPVAKGRGKARGKARGPAKKR